LEKIGGFRNAYLALISNFPVLTISYFYITKAIILDPKVERKVQDLKEMVENQFSPVTFEFKFLGATELLSSARKSPTSAYHLRLVENPISTGQQGFVCLVSINDYFNFICEEDGRLNNYIFEGNVRDYQGNIEVNQQIRETLEQRGPEDFWWLNNGISIICSRATLSGKVLSLENPEIVNGLQTSREIYNVFSESSDVEEGKNLLVRIIVPEEELSRDKIIKATNSQTNIPPASLRATDTIHRNIEEYLAVKGLYYDRRKNYYKNQGKPIKKIISIPFMAQSVLACALYDPGNARGRPSSLLKDNDAYASIFNTNYPLDLYFKCSKLTRMVEDVLKSERCPIDRSHSTNLKFYGAMIAALKLTGLPHPRISNFANIDLGAATEDFLLDCVSEINQIYEVLGATDKVAKGSEFSRQVIEAHKEKVEMDLRSQEQA